LTKKFAFDIDGTIANFMECFIFKYNKEYNSNKKTEDVIKWDLSSLFFNDNKERFTAFMHEALAGIGTSLPKLYDGAFEFLSQCYKMYYPEPLLFITHRPFIPEIVEFTKKFTEVNFLNNGICAKLEFCNCNKLDVLGKYRISNFCDDKVQDFVNYESNIDNLKNTNVKLYVPVRPWNENLLMKIGNKHPNITIFSSWKVLYEYIFC